MPFPNLWMAGRKMTMIELDPSERSARCDPCYGLVSNKDLPDECYSPAAEACRQWNSYQWEFQQAACVDHRYGN
jgi:hypothetical protein